MAYKRPSYIHDEPGPGRVEDWTDNGDGQRYWIGYVDVAAQDRAWAQSRAARARREADPKYQAREQQRREDQALQAQVNEYFQAAIVRHRESCDDEYECRRRAHADADLFRQSLQRKRREERKKPQER